MKTLTVLLIFVFYSISCGFAGGKLTGKVLDLETGEPLVGANILICSTSFGTATDENGEYIIINIPRGKYRVVARYIGYREALYSDITIISDSTTILDFSLPIETYTTDVVVVQAQAPLVKKNITNSTSVVRREDIVRLPVRGVKPVTSTQKRSERGLNIRGSRSNGVAYYIDGVLVTNPTFGGTRIHETGFKKVIENPMSTFSIDVDAASYTNVRSYIENGHLPPKDAVRIEEFINYFNYKYQEPTGEDPIAINIEYSDCPWNQESKLVHIGLKGKELKRDELQQSNFVFLIDVSGSMRPRNKLPLVKESFLQLVNHLKPVDRVAIVVYASEAEVVLPSVSGDYKERIREAISDLSAGGSTAGAAGIQLAYEIAKENFIDGGNNRVILATDGDFNVGISSTPELVRYIEKKREEGIFFTILGFGMGNYKDDRLQEIADRGNGNHAYIDDIFEAKKVLVYELTGTLYTIAKDVKIQVHFNPVKVKSYRLIGYENRRLANEDFEDDKKDAGEIGAGHTVTSIYEIELNKQNISYTQDLKYQSTIIKESAYSSNELMTINLRYKQPDGENSREISKTLKDSPIEFSSVSNNFKFSAAVCQFALLLYDSEYKGNSSVENILELANSSIGEDMYGYRVEFINLVEEAENLLEDRIAQKDDM